MLCQRRAARIIAGTQRQRNAGKNVVRSTVAVSLASSSVQDQGLEFSILNQGSDSRSLCDQFDVSSSSSESKPDNCPPPTGRPRWMSDVGECGRLIPEPSGRGNDKVLEQQLLPLQLARRCVRLRSELSTRHTFFRRDNPAGLHRCSDPLLELLLRELECPGRASVSTGRSVLRLVRPVVDSCAGRSRLRLRAAIAAGTHPRAVATAERVLRNLVREFVQCIQPSGSSPSACTSTWPRSGEGQCGCGACLAPRTSALRSPLHRRHSARPKYAARSWGPQPAQLRTPQSRREIPRTVHQRAPLAGTEKGGANSCQQAVAAAPAPPANLGSS